MGHRKVLHFLISGNSLILRGSFDSNLENILWMGEDDKKIRLRPLLIEHNTVIVVGGGGGGYISLWSQNDGFLLGIQVNTECCFSLFVIIWKNKYVIRYTYQLIHHIQSIFHSLHYPLPPISVLIKNCAYCDMGYAVVLELVILWENCG